MSVMAVSIAFEGSETAGKTALHLLTYLLLEKITPFKVYRSYEPGSTMLSEAVRAITRDEKFKDAHPLSHVLLYNAARADLFYRREMPFMTANPDGVLLKDRSWLSTVCLQTVDGADLHYIEQIQRPFMVYPDKFVIIDIPVEETLVRLETERRMGSKRSIDWRDKQTIQNLGWIRQNYLSYASKNREKSIVVSCLDELSLNSTRVVKEVFALKNIPFSEEEGARFVEESKAIMQTHTTRNFTAGDGVGRDLLTFNVDAFNLVAQEVRRELGIPTVEDLRHGMMVTWRELGLIQSSTNRERGG